MVDMTYLILFSDFMNLECKCRLDEEMIGSLFGYNLQNLAKIDEAKSKTSSPCKHVLDHKRLQNVTILLKALNATAEQVSHALMEGRFLADHICVGLS